MFCNKCGERLVEGVLYCPKCGNKLPQTQEEITNPAKTEVNPSFNYADNVTNQANNNNDHKNKNHLIKIIAGVLGVVAVVLLVFQFFGGGNHSVEAPVKNFLNAARDGDYDKMFDSFPREMLDELSDGDLDILESQMEEYFAYFRNINYEIQDKEKLYEDELEDIKEEWEDYFKIKDAYSVEVELFMKGYEGYSESVEFVVVKIGSKYYVVDGDLF